MSERSPSSPNSLPFLKALPPLMYLNCIVINRFISAGGPRVPCCPHRLRSNPTGGIFRELHRETSERGDQEEGVQEHHEELLPAAGQLGFGLGFSLGFCLDMLG